MVLLLALALVACGGAKEAPQAVDKEVSLNVGHYFPAEDFRGQTVQKWADLVQELSKGSIKINIFPNEQLVKGKEGFQALSQGIVDVYPLLTSYVSGQVPLLDIFNLPLHPDNYTDDVILKILDESRPIWEEQFAKNNIKYLGVANTSAGPSYCYFSKPVHTLEQFKGLKMRGAGGLLDEAMTMLGSSVTFMSAAEQYMALQTGTVDGCSTTFSSYISGKVYEVAPYQLRVKLFHAPYLIAMNMTKYNSLSPNQQKIIMEATKKTQEWSSQKLDEIIKEQEATIKANSKEMYTLPADEFKKWDEVVKPLYNKYVEKNGAEAQKLMDIRAKYLK